MESHGDNRDNLIQMALDVAAVFVSKYGAGALGDIDDVTQTAILIALKRLQNGTNEKNLRPSIFFGLIDEARRLCHFRTKVRTCLFDASDSILESPDDFQTKIDSRDHVSTIEKTLTPKELEITRLIQYGYKQTEIAKLLNVNRSTITRRIQRIRKKILVDKKDACCNKKSS